MDLKFVGVMLGIEGLVLLYAVGVARVGARRMKETPPSPVEALEPELATLPPEQRYRAVVAAAAKPS